MDSRHEEKQARRADKELQSIELHDIIRKIHDDMQADREKSEQDRRESKDGKILCCYYLIVN